MDRESFESRIRSKFESKEIKAPRSIWNGISAGLTDSTISLLQKSQFRLKLVAAAAIVLAILSFANQFLPGSKAESDPRSGDFNALTSNYFENLLVGPSDFQSTVNFPIVWVVETKEEPRVVQREGQIQIEEEDESETLRLHEVNARSYPIRLAEVKSNFDPYYRPSYHSLKRVSSKERTFWAGVEAGAGNFNAEMDGSSPISGAVDFSTVANAIGQSGFVNPSSSAAQTEMSQGIVTSLGLDFGVKMGDRWTVESGVQYSSIQNQSTALLNVVDIYTITNTAVLDPDDLTGGSAFAARTTQVQDDYEHSVELDNDVRFTSIPLKAGYFLLDSKFSMRLNAGLTANFLLSNTVSDPSNQIQNPTSNELFNEWTFDGLTGIEFGYSLNQNFNVTFEPNYRQSLTPLSTSLITRNGFMIQTGIRYNIR